jgi:hypothetical protein
MRNETRWWKPGRARGRSWLAVLTLVLCAVAGEALAEAAVQRTFQKLPSSNGHGAVLLDLGQKRLTHFREHLYATEEPQLDANGAEVFSTGTPSVPLVVSSRDLLYDAYFGLRSGGTQRWLTSEAVDLEASGYAAWASGKVGGTGIATMVQRVGSLEVTQFAFAPQGLPHAGFVLAVRVRNDSIGTASGVSVFSLHNFHLGFGRPGINADIDENGETVLRDGDLFVERAFAGVIVARPLGAVARRSAWNLASPASENAYSVVNGGGTADLPDWAGPTSSAGTGWATAYQFNLGNIAPGAEAWAGVVFAHHGDPFADATVKRWLADYVGTSDARQLVEAEVARWATFQQALKVPAGVAADEEHLLRHSAVILRMAQVREQEAYMREFLTKDGEPRRTRLRAANGTAATLPATLPHKGYGAVLASLPPGEWTYAWIRDGAYAVAAMATLGMRSEARDGLAYYLKAEGGRFQAWDELKPYNMPPYIITLTRYHGFGVEETDFNSFGPNLEFDGFGLFLWALRHYERETGDTTLVTEHWSTVSTRVADALVGLVDPTTGLIRPDSSIWETHWQGRERAWAYTSLTAARGLCDAAALATRVGDTQAAVRYREAGLKLREAIARKLTDNAYALASNTRELGAGRGYSDAAVMDAIAMGLFDPAGKIASATLARLDAQLSTAAGAGWARNDDRTDHAGGPDLSPWGSEYDSAEWVIVDLRGAIAKRMAGDTARADRVLQWVKEQSLKNYLVISETYDEGTGAYKFNAPMAGFGAGAYALALAHRASTAADPACDAYFDESTLVKPGGPDGGTSGPDAGTDAPDAGGPVDLPGEDGDSGCGCGAGGAGVLAAWLLVALAGMARRR